MKVKFIDVNYEQTGGGVFTYWGRISYNRWFCYCLDRLGFLDDDIDKVLKAYFANEDEPEYDEDFDMYDWENEHTIWEYERKFENGEDDKEELVEDFLNLLFEALTKKYPKDKNLKLLRYKEIGY